MRSLTNGQSEIREVPKKRQQKSPKWPSIKTASNNDTGRRNSRGSKRRKNLSKFQCHKLLHCRTNTGKTRKKKRALLNFIIERSTIHFVNMKTGFSFWQRRDFVVHLIVECLSVKSRIYDRGRCRWNGNFSRSIAIDFFRMFLAVDRSGTWTALLWACEAREKKT